MPGLSRLSLNNITNEFYSRRRQLEERDDPDLEPLSPEEISSLTATRHGRRFHSYGAQSIPAPYPLPCDMREMARLNNLHDALHELLGGQNYFGPVQEVLAPLENESDQKTVIDLCTGTGKWVDEMAEEFPHVKFHGVDIAPIANEYPGDNVWFEIANVMEPLRWSDRSVNLVHMRDSSLGIIRPRYPRILAEIARILQPRGLFLSCEWTRRLGTFDGANPQIRAPNAVALLHSLNENLLNRGVMLDPTEMIHEINMSTSFRDARSFQLPALLDNSDGNTDPQKTQMRNRFKQTLLEFGIATFGFFVDCGISRERVNDMIRQFCNDIENVNGLVIYYNVIFASRA